MTGKAPVLVLNDGNKIPVVALGTGRATAGEADIEEVRHAVLWAIEAGYRHVDTAAFYKDEQEVGQGIADAIANGVVKREDLFVTTKLWGDNHGEQKVVPALRESLQKLGLDYVDLYLIHFPVALKEDGSPAHIEHLDTWKGMEEAKNLELTKSIGVSNFNVNQLDRLFAGCRIIPAVNQIEVNPTMTQEALVSHCRKLGVVVMAYSPFGFLVSRTIEHKLPPRVDDPKLVAMAEKYGKSTGQIVLRYLLDRGLVIIPKSTSRQRIRQNIDIFDFTLTSEELELISTFNKNIRVINAAYWKGYPDFQF